MSESKYIEATEESEIADAKRTVDNLKSEAVALKAEVAALQAERALHLHTVSRGHAAAARTPMEQITMRSDAAAGLEARLAALDALVKLGKRAAPALPEIVSQLGRARDTSNGWNLAWKALKALKTAGVAAQVPADIIAAIDVVATAPSNKRHNVETALNAAAVAAGDAITPHLSQVLRHVWLIQTHEEDPPHMPTDHTASDHLKAQEGTSARYFQLRRDEYAAAAEERQRRWAAFHEREKECDRNEALRQVAKGVLQACAAHAADLVPAVLANLHAPCAKLRCEALSLCNLTLLKLVSSTEESLALVLEACTRAARESDEHLRGEAAVTAGALLQQDRDEHLPGGLSYRPGTKRKRSAPLPPAGRTVLRRLLISLLDDRRRRRRRARTVGLGA